MLPISNTVKYNLMNFNSLVEFFIHFLKQYMFLPTPKKTWLQSKLYQTPLPLKCMLRQPQGGSLREVCPTSPRHVYLLKPPERQVCRFWEATKPRMQHKRKMYKFLICNLQATPINHYLPLQPTGQFTNDVQALSRPSACTNRHNVNTPQLTFSLCDSHVSMLSSAD